MGRIGLTLCLLLSFNAVASAAGSPPPTKGASKAAELACLKGIFDPGADKAPQSLHGSASPKVLAAFPTLTKPTKLPARANLSESLRQTGVISYDPTHATLLRRTHAGPVYLIPAEVGRLPKPAACRKVRDADAYVDARRTEQGAGPGVVAYGRAAESASAGSLAAINGFEDGPQILNGGSSGSFVVPDSVAQVRYVLPGNRIRSEHVSHNLVAGPFTKSPPQLPKAGFTSPYAKRFTAWIEKYEPTAIRWIGANGKLIATHKRPRGEITTDIRVFRFLSTVLRSATVLSTG